MPRCCCQCGNDNPLYLHHGKLLCRACLDLAEVPLLFRVAWTIQEADFTCREARRLLDQCRARRKGR